MQLLQQVSIWLRTSNQRTNGPVNAHLTSGAAVSTNEKDRIKNSREIVATSFFFYAQGQVSMWSGVGSGRILNSSKLLDLCMSSLPASMKRIRSETAEKKWQHHFSHYKSMGIFSDAQGQLTPQSILGSG